MSTRDLTPKQWALIRELIRAEARRIGYGTTYTEDNRRGTGWPPRLRALRATIVKLQDR